MEFDFLLTPANLGLLFFITFAAYYIKGLTGFGPALIVVPFFTALAGVRYALPASALFDALAGALLLIPIFKKINWKFCLPLMLAMGVGSFIGANVLFLIPQTALRTLIGIFILAFGSYLWLSPQESGRQKMITEPGNRVRAGGITVGFLGGISGGMVGMSGPILVVYLKYLFSKDFFRTQLIAIFLIENLVRLSIYFQRGLLDFRQARFLLACLPALLLGLWLGNLSQLRISERVFNQVVATILILVSLKIILL